MSDRQVAFELWLDPFRVPGEQADDFDDDQEYALARRAFIGDAARPAYSGQVLASPITGVFPLGDHNLPSYKFKLWYMHTNFVLTEMDEATINGVAGVAGWRPLDPYRGLLMVGCLFKDAEVHEGLRQALCPPAKPAQAKVTEDPLVSAAKQQWIAWAIVKRGPKNRDIIRGLTREEVEAKVKLSEAEVLKTSWEGDGGKG